VIRHEHLAQADRLIAECLDRIARQREVITTEYEQGLPTDIGPTRPVHFWITKGGKLVGKPIGLFYHSDIKSKFSIAGSPGRIRTSDQPVNSRLLYR
jgi:hypothetical protein